MAGKVAAASPATRKLGHYRILEKIGSGGMGEVYRARDERLDREVAIKLLPAGLLADETARKRFRNEALALSKFNHPNIATIYGFDAERGADFIVTELIKGETLADRMPIGRKAAPFFPRLPGYRHADYLCVVVGDGGEVIAALRHCSHLKPKPDRPPFLLCSSVRPPAMGICKCYSFAPFQPLLRYTSSSSGMIERL